MSGSSDRPNLLLFVADSWRGDALGAAGDPAAHTPNFDRLAGEGAYYPWAFCQNPVCVPSRCSFMTGRYPHTNGHRTMHHPLEFGEPHLLETLSQAGYRILWGGKNDLLSPAALQALGVEPFWGALPFAAYFDGQREAQWRGSPEGDDYYSFFRGPMATAPDSDRHPDKDWEVIDWARQRIERADEEADPDQPFCLYINLFFPHPPYAAEEHWVEAIDPDRLPPRIDQAECSPRCGMLRTIAQRNRLAQWDEQRWRRLKRVYYGMIARVDHQLGLLMEALERSGQRENTAVVAFSDHGDFTGDYGLVEKAQNAFEDCLTRVPLAIRPPADVPLQPGRREALAELADIPATVAALAGIELPYTQFGRSLLPSLANSEAPHRDGVLCEGGRRLEEIHTREARPGWGQSSRYWPKLSAQADEGAAHSKAVMWRTHQYKYVRRPDEADELYALADDPGERINRIDDSQLAPIAQEMRLAMLDEMIRTADAVPIDTTRPE